MISIRERPPIWLDIGVLTPAGSSFHWGFDEPRPENNPTGLTFGTTMPGGFDQATVTLPRKPGVDYSDLERLSDVTVRGAGEQVAWEGRLETSPRASGDQMAVSPGLVGWQAHLDDNQNAQAIYVSQDASQWVDAPLDEQIRLAAAGISNGDMSWSSQNGGLVCALPNQAVGAASVAELWFIAPSGVLIAKVMYVGADTTPPGGWETPALFSHSELLESPATSDAMTLDGTLHTTTCTTPHRAVSVRVYSNGTGATPASGSQRAISQIGVYGNTGIPTSPISGYPDGVLASDVVAHAITTWCPLLKAQIDASAFAIPHLVFTSLPNTASDIIKAATQFELQDWWVDENRTFHMAARGSHGRQWRARVGPAQLQETGPQVARLWNQAVVQYSDVDGIQRTVGPPGSGCDTTDASLVDTDPLNPANQAGDPRVAVTQMGTSTPDGAVKVGSQFLQAQKELDTSGQASLVGYVEDASGITWPAWRVRAGDYVSFVDASSTAPRRVVSTSFDESSKTNAVSLDSPPDGLAALLQRMSIKLIGTGLS